MGKAWAYDVWLSPDSTSDDSGSMEPSTPAPCMFSASTSKSPILKLGWGRQLAWPQPTVSTHLVTECGELALQFPLLSQHLLLVLIFFLKLHFHLFQLQNRGERALLVPSVTRVSQSPCLLDLPTP